MRVYKPGRYGAANGRPVEITTAVDDVCRPDPYSYSGALERAEERANNAVAMLGRLIDNLFESNVINGDVVCNLLNNEYEIEQ